VARLLWYPVNERAQVPKRLGAKQRRIMIERLRLDRQRWRLIGRQAALCANQIWR
jgi:hypothetical protein